ncbi:MAG: NAD(+) synthase [Bacteroidales bacterium]|nr:NAD(+) synthase [Bacteroidales bacterium]
MSQGKKTGFHKDILKLQNIEETINAILKKLREDVHGKLKRHGGVIGISGGIDSSVTMALAAKAFGSDNVLGVLLPEKDSSSDSEKLALELAAKFNVKTITENITGALSGFKCYERRDEAVKNVFPEYDPATYKMKIGIKTNPSSKLPPVFSVIIITPDGEEKSKKLHAKDYMQIVAASNFKQRSRMSMLYYHAERLHYAVIGTPNKHEVDQGFFVKYGDGGADVMPIGNLYKTQVYEIARYLGVPQGIIDRTPTTDTYSAEQTQEEFFYQFPFEIMDLLWFAFENSYDPVEVGKVMGHSEEDILHIFDNFKRKNLTTEYLRMSPIRDY